MAFIAIKTLQLPSLLQQNSRLSSSFSLNSPKPHIIKLDRNSSKSSKMLSNNKAYSLPELGVQGAVSGLFDLIQTSPPTWESSILNNLIIFILGSPILVTGLSLSGISAAFLLGTLTWRAFGPTAFLLVATYFVIGTAVTKVKMAQKEAQGVAEKRKGRRGPGSVIGSSAAGCVCALFSIYGVGGAAFSGLWQLGFVASFCTKLSDTVSSEIGKAYGRTTYLVTSFKVVPRGTEGAVSIEGTIAGLLAAVLLAYVGCLMGEVNPLEAAICVVASQIANLGESMIGAVLQDKEGFKWLNNDAVNVINISLGSVLAVLMQQILLQNWHPETKEGPLPEELQGLLQQTLQIVSDGLGSILCSLSGVSPLLSNIQRATALLLSSCLFCLVKDLVKTPFNIFMIYQGQ